MITAGIDHDWEEIGHKAARFGSISPENRELHSILSTGLTQTRFLDSRAIKKELAGPAFDFSDNEAEAGHGLAHSTRPPSRHSCQMVTSYSNNGNSGINERYAPRESAGCYRL